MVKNIRKSLIDEYQKKKRNKTRKPAKIKTDPALKRVPKTFLLIHEFILIFLIIKLICIYF